MKLEKVIIIGAGPAGIATAIQLKRYGIDPLLFEKNEIGGLLINANLVENYPGFPNGISGSELVELFKKHLNNNFIKIIFEEVIGVEFKEKLFRITTSKETFYSKIVVIATGTKPKEFADFKIPEQVKDKIFYEISPILGVKGKTIVVVGAGDSAFDYALNLEKNNEVVILNRGKTTKCLPVLWERAKKSSKIKYLENTKIFNIIENSKDELLFELRGEEGLLKIFANYVIFALGREPQLDFLSENLEKIKKKLVKKELLFFIGDVKNSYFRQTAIAVGDGIMTAMKIKKIIMGEAL